MLKRTLFFGNPYHLSTKLDQLVIVNKDTGEERMQPIEDMGFVVFEHPHITFTQSVMQLMAENNTAVVFCDKKHHPSSMLLHLDTHQVQTELFRHQVNASEPLKKQVWQQTVKAKINNQAALLDYFELDGTALRYLSTQVKSGDTTNEEAQAARRYWPRLFGKTFTRERFGQAPNPALNYGYAILRAAIARGLAGSGLHPTLGIHHRNKYNSYCLADDIMEPYRPYVDLVVKQMVDDELNCEDLSTPEKTALLGLLSMDVHIGNKKRPLMVGISETTASLSRVFKGEDKKVKYPELAHAK